MSDGVGHLFSQLPSIAERRRNWVFLEKPQKPQGDFMFKQASNSVPGGDVYFAQMQSRIVHLRGDRSGFFRVGADTSFYELITSPNPTTFSDLAAAETLTGSNAEATT